MSKYRFNFLTLFFGLLLLSGPAVSGEELSAEKIRSQPVEIYPAVGPETQSTNGSRVRIRFEIDDPSIFSELGIQAVDFCKHGNIGNNCGRAQMHADGTATDEDGQIDFAYAVLPPGNSGRHLVIQAHNGGGDRPKLTKKQIKLDEELTLIEEYNYELIIGLVPHANNKYKPYLAGFEAMGPSENKVRAFVPGQASSVNLPGGIKVNLSANTLADTALIGYETSRGGFKGGTLSVSAADAFVDSVSVLVEFDLTDINNGDVISNFDFRLNGELITAVDTGQFSNGRAVIEVAMHEAGILSIMQKNELEMSHAKEFAAIAKQNLRALPTDQCVANITAIMNGTTDVFQYADQYGVVSFASCLSVYPNVHMVVTKVDAAINTTTISADRSAAGSAHAYDLKTITEHAQAVGAFAAINGFVWDGDNGRTDGFGDFLGTHYVNGVNVSNRSGAEVLMAFTDKSLGVNFVAFVDKPAGVTVNFGAYNYNVVASTSSIMKGGVCSSSSGSPGPVNRWSSIGVKDQYLVMLSTDSNKEITPFDLCQVYAALGVTDALRLDGSNAAAIYINGTHLNPLTGFERLIIGSARHILYGLAVQ